MCFLDSQDGRNWRSQQKDSGRTASLNCPPPAFTLNKDSFPACRPVADLVLISGEHLCFTQNSQDPGTMSGRNHTLSRQINRLLVSIFEKIILIKRPQYLPILRLRCLQGLGWTRLAAGKTESCNRGELKTGVLMRREGRCQVVEHSMGGLPYVSFPSRDEYAAPFYKGKKLCTIIISRLPHVFPPN